MKSEQMQTLLEENDRKTVSTGGDIKGSW